MTYTWDARRGRNLHVAWPANARARQARASPDGLGPRGRDPAVRQNQDARRLHPGREAGRSWRREPKAANAALADTKEIEKIEKIEKTFTPALRSLRAPPCPPTPGAKARAPALAAAVCSAGSAQAPEPPFGAEVASPGARLTGAPDWALEDDEDEDDTATVSADGRRARRCARRTIARRDGEVVAPKVERAFARRAVVSRGARRWGPGSTEPSRARCARARRAAQDGRLPGAEWRTAHRDALVAAGTRSRGMASAASEPAPVSFGVGAERWRRHGADRRYGVEADLALGYGSASQPFSRSKAHVPGDSARRSTTRTFRDEPEVARAVARVARARDSKAADAATLAAASKAIRGRSTAALGSEGSEGVGRSSPDASPGRGPVRAGADSRRVGVWGAGTSRSGSVRRRAFFRALGDARTIRARRGVPSASVRLRRRGSAAAGDPTSPASHIARLGALSASFSDRQRAMVGRGVQEARTRIRDERSWGK